MSDEAEPGRALAGLIGRLERIDDQLAVLRARSAVSADGGRWVRGAAWLVLLATGVAALAGLLRIDRELRRHGERIERIEQDARRADRGGEQMRGEISRELRKLSGLPEALAAPAAEDRALREKLQREAGRLQQELATLRKELAQATEGRDRLLTRIHFLDAQNKALQQQAEQLGRLARSKAPASQAAPRATPVELGRLLEQINTLLRHDGRRRLLRLVSAEGFSGGRLDQVQLEERTAERKLLQRVWARSARIELFAEHRLLRIALDGCRRTFSGKDGKAGLENRLPSLTLELYDVNVKSWQEQAGPWLSVR